MGFLKTLDYIEGLDEKEEFFEKIINQIRQLKGYKSRLLEVRSGELAYQQNLITDDRITYLLYADEFVVASVVQIRTKSNKTTHNFFNNSREFEKYLLNS